MTIHFDPYMIALVTSSYCTSPIFRIFSFIKCAINLFSIYLRREYFILSLNIDLFLMNDTLPPSIISSSFISQSILCTLFQDTDSFMGSTPKQQPIDRHVNFFCWEKSRPVKKLICSESGYGFHSINFIETYFSTTVPQVLSKCLLRNFFYMFRRPAVDGTHVRLCHAGGETRERSGIHSFLQ